MTTLDAIAPGRLEVERTAFARRPATRTEQVTLALCATWLVGGLLVDAWAHDSRVEIESFFNPYHGMMYSGGLACMVALVLSMRGNILRGASLRDSIPLGLDGAVTGAVLVLVSGIGDMVWHSLFGIENGLRINFSPSHILLIVGIGLLASGPWAVAARALRAGEVDARTASRWATAWPAVLSAVLVAAQFNVNLSFASGIAGGNVLHIDRLVDLGDAGTLAQFELVQTAQRLGILNLLGTVLLVSFVVGTAARTLALPAGAFTVICGLIAAAGLTHLIDENWELVLGFAAGGLLTDLVAAGLGHRADTLVGRTALGFTLAAAVAAGYVAGTGLRYQELAFEAELWTGTIFWSGVLGGIVALAAGDLRRRTATGGLVAAG